MEDLIISDLEKLAREIRNFSLPVMRGQDTIGEWHLDDYEALKIAAMLFRNGWRYDETKDERKKAG